MTRTLTRFSLLAVLAFGVTFAGCSSDDPSPVAGGDDDVSGTESLDTLDLDEAYGGLSFSDEAEAFGDDELLSAAMVEEAAALSEDEEDSLTDDDPTLDRPGIRRTYVKILWGQLDGEFDPDTDRSDQALLDWSGSVKVTEGVVALKRTILFERPRDHRLPRSTRDSLAWVSHTGPHFDGILICVMSPVEDGVAQGELILETPQFRTSLSIDTLDGYEQFTEVDAEGNAVAIRAAVIEPQGCAAGFLAGFWKGVEDRPETDAIERGVFRGRFVGQAGMTTGFLKGFYGLNSEGERVMAGKFIGRNGRVRGLVAGTWTPDESGDGMGTFEARWVNRNGLRMGVLAGVYQAHEAEGRGDGFFEGRYHEICDDGVE